MKYRNLPECTEEKQKEYFKLAQEFLDSSKGLYSSASSVAKCAIANYMAFKDGTQLIRK